ncbi:MAG: AI-2E family transporter [candidate division Zixibacteria bacterium]|nr:AI-2E family transporter [candidate division Zixibacteria bacterium]
MGNDQKGDSKQLMKKVLIASSAVILLLLILLIIQQVVQMLLVALAGLLLAVFLNGIAKPFRSKTKLPQALSVTIVVFGLVLLLVVSVWIMGPHIAEQFSSLTERVPTALENIEGGLQESKWGRDLLSRLPEVKEKIPFESEFIWGITGVFSTALGTITSLLVILFIGLYCAADPDLYINNFIKMIPKEKRKRAREVITAMGNALRMWLLARVASMVVVGILTAAGLSIIGIQLALTLGIIAALLSFVPFIGPPLGAIPALLVALAESPILAVYVLITYMIVQTLESYIITPLIFSTTLSLPPAFLITIQVVMGVLFGAMGIAMASPLTVAIVVLVQMIYIQDILKDDVRVMGQ